MLQKKKILITGAMGKSGLSAAILYKKLGAIVILSDVSASAPLPDSLQGCVDVRPRQDTALLEEYRPDFIVTAPGVPLADPIFAAASERKIPIYGENDYAYFLISSLWKKQPFFIAVTGTDGKSTTTALIAHIIEKTLSIRSVPCGNFGSPLSDFAAEEPANPVVFVVECSSFQLEAARYFHPQTAMILNLASDHLDRYRDMHEYLRAKLNITRCMTAEDLLIAPSQILEKARGIIPPAIRLFSLPPDSAVESGQGPVHFRGRELCDIGDFSPPGRHNRENLQFALLALEDFSSRNGQPVDIKKLAEAVRTFSALPHRTQKVAEQNGLIFINDSKATTVQSVLAAVSSFPGKRIFLLCGGRDKGSDFRPLLDVGENVSIYPYGEAGPKIAGSIHKQESYNDLQTALNAAVHHARAQRARGVILLSPGCSSFDAYTSYAQRGDHFVSLVRAIVDEQGAGV